MNRLRPRDFPEFFRAVHEDYEPFPWQNRLLQRVLRGQWPEALVLPTAAGKTACIDVALFALAADAVLPPSQRTAPRRIFFVVDRRVIVDEAFEHARLLAGQLTQARGGILKRVADNLRIIAGAEPGQYDSTPPLMCSQLRGGIYREHAWTRSPLQPSVIASTVDQIGSRLLHRGYGVSRYMWPIHAGLIGNDSLVLLDEAHCANPFRETLQAIARYRGDSWSDRPLASPFHFVIISATPPSDVADVVGAEEDDLRHEELGRRIKASKPTRLVLAAKAKGRDVDKVRDALAEELVAQATGLAAGGVKSIGILVNQVATAKRVQKRLEQAGQGNVDLLIGRMREVDRRAVVEKCQAAFAATKAAFTMRRQWEHPRFVVATQCLEVGANLDFDAMVSECASLDALRQRFGRLNRLGLLDSSPGCIVMPAYQFDNKQGDWVYGNALLATWNWLIVNGDDDAIDMGAWSLGKAIDESVEDNPDLLCQLNAPAPDAPVMLPAHVDYWTQTDPVPTPDPDVSIFLHGPQRDAAEVQVLWRADLDPQYSESWATAVSLCPPSSAECMPVPLHVIRRWWISGTTAGHVGDLVGGTPQEEEYSSDGSRRLGLRWLGGEESEVIQSPDDIRPGDIVVLPVEQEGWEEFGHIPEVNEDRIQIDQGDQTHLEQRRRAVLRLHSRLLAVWPAAATEHPEHEAYNRLRSVVCAADLPEKWCELRDPLADLLAGEGCPNGIRPVVQALIGDKRRQVARHPCPVVTGQKEAAIGGVVLIGSRRLVPGVDTLESLAQEDDAASAMLGPRTDGAVVTTLRDHNQGVAELAESLARGCGLPEELVSDLALAGYLHDVGKADPRFQAWLHKGNAMAAVRGPLLAKSTKMPQNSRDLEFARQKAGYPKGGRHELLSVRLAESSAEFLQAASDSDLVLHLIASHHGRCRPFAPVVEDRFPVEVTIPHDGHALEASSTTGLEVLDSGVAERFWRLVRRYGWWGLAWLEAILRLADHRRSQYEEQRAEGDGR